MPRPHNIELLLYVQQRLTDRDLVLLGWLADHKSLTTDQIAHALYTSPGFAQRRLLKLTQAGVLTRFRPFRTGGGTGPYHYLLTQLGEDIMAAQRNQDTLPRRDHARRQRWYLTNRANLPHLVAVNQFFTDLAGYARTHPGHTLERWWPASRCQTPGAFSYLDPDNIHRLYDATIAADGHGIWTAPITYPDTSPETSPETSPQGSPRSTTALSGSPQWLGASGPAGLGPHSWLELDRLARNRRDGVQRVAFFTEIDLGTEDHTRLRAKLDAYERFTHTIGRSWPVLFWFTSSIRERHFHQRLTRQPSTATVATATTDHATAQAKSPADDIWWLHHPTHDHHDAHDFGPAGRLRLRDLAAHASSPDPRDPTE